MAISALSSNTSVDAFETPIPSPRDKNRKVAHISPVKADVTATGNLTDARGSSRSNIRAGSLLEGLLRSIKKQGAPSRTTSYSTGRGDGLLSSISLTTVSCSPPAKETVALGTQ
eukprot:scaffold69933_cov25-Tisochrysis_lutea.AAC.7